MKENIYTIPINEVFDMDCECPICEFVKNEELKRVEYSLGASMMEPDERITSNEMGYCQRHTQMMYKHGNKLSHALVLETRIKYLADEIVKMEHMLSKIKPSGILGKFKKQDLSQTAEYKSLTFTAKSCVICKRLDDITNAFISNLFHMYKNDVQFRDKFFASKGFCIDHFDLLMNKAQEHLDAEDSVNFLSKLCKLQREHLERVMDDVNWFTKKFDYRYKDAEWKNSKDAVQRGCLKISGYLEE